MFNFQFDASSTDEELIEMYKVLRDKYPLFWSEEHRCWIISRYNDVVSGLANYDLFTYADTDSMVGRDLLSLTSGTQTSNYSIELPPEYPKNRKIIMDIYNQRISNNLEEKIKINIKNLFNTIKNEESVEAISRITNYIPILTTCEMTGYDYKYAEDILSIASKLWDRNDVAERIRLVKKIYEFLTTNKPDQYLTDTTDQGFINKFNIGLFLGGSSSLAGLLPMLIYFVYNYPNQFEKVLKNKKLINNFIQETIRHAFIQSHLIRTASNDVKIYDSLIKKGDRVAFLIGSANFDENKFGDDAQQFKINRNYSKVNLAFGHGMYRCVGYSTSELQLKLLLSFIIDNKNNIIYKGAEFKEERNFTGTLINKLYLQYIN